MKVDRRSVMKAVLALLTLSTQMLAQQPSPKIAPTGYVSKADTDLAYWVYGQPGTATPVFAVNGGP